jgi:Na+-translocating ferredoxin:NAD+ oxidoreductase RnfE subunit
MDSAPAGTREAPLVMLLLALVPSVAVAVRVADALWLAAGVLLVMVGSSVARALLDGERVEGAQGAAVPGAGDPEAGAAAADGPSPEDRTAGWLRALVISSILTAAFEAGLLAVAPAASAALGIYAPLIAVNFLVVGRGGCGPSGASLPRTALSSLRNAAWFAGGLVAIALVREVLGAGTITLFPAGGFGGTISVSPLLDQPVRALGFAGGGLLCLGYLAAAVRAVLARKGPPAPRAEAMK